MSEPWISNPRCKRLKEWRRDRSEVASSVLVEAKVFCLKREGSIGAKPCNECWQKRRGNV
jgi:hypothetical protein